MEREITRESELVITPRTVIVLAANYRKQGNKYVFPEIDNDLAFGGDYRLRAAAAMYHQRLAPLIIVNGGTIKQQEISGAHAQALRLLELGVPQSAIYETQEDQDPEYRANTLGDIRYLKKYLKDFPYAIGPSVITSRYHVERTRELFKRCDFELNFLPAEDILEALEPQCHEEVAFFYSNGEMKARVAMENKGLTDIRNGTYRYL